LRSFASITSSSSLAAMKRHTAGSIGWRTTGREKPAFNITSDKG
jgi:hypothetical protein